MNYQPQLLQDFFHQPYLSFRESITPCKSLALWFTGFGEVPEKLTKNDVSVYLTCGARWFSAIGNDWLLIARDFPLKFEVLDRVAWIFLVRGVIPTNSYTPPKTNMNTQNDGFAWEGLWYPAPPKMQGLDAVDAGVCRRWCGKVTPFKIAIFDIYARFLGCKFFEQKSFSHPAGEENWSHPFDAIVARSFAVQFPVVFEYQPTGGFKYFVKTFQPQRSEGIVFFRYFSSHVFTRGSKTLL